MIALFQDFLSSFFPHPSPFELPPHISNVYLRWEDYERVRYRVDALCDLGWGLLGLWLVGRFGKKGGDGGRNARRRRREE